MCREAIYFARSEMRSFFLQPASLLAVLNSTAQHAVDRTQFGTVPEMAQEGQLISLAQGLDPTSTTG